MATKLDTAANQAYEAFAARTTVMLAPRRDMNCLGSGVLLRNAKGVPFLVTARHLFTDDEWHPVEWRPLHLLVPGLGGPFGATELRDVGVDRVFAPGRTPEKPVDVALVTLREDLHQCLRALAAGVDQVADDDRVEPTDVIFLVGFPAFLAFEPAANVRMFSTITYTTGVTGTDEHGRLEVQWDEAIPHEDAPRFPHIKAEPGKVVRLGGPDRGPGGVSGGALWRIRGCKPGDAIWSPSSHAQLIGVPVAWNMRATQFAESVTAWGPWLKTTADQLR